MQFPQRRDIQLFFKRWVFLLSSTSIMVFWSEKVYWYIQGYEWSVLILAYLPAVYIVFKAIDQFKINDFWSLIIASLFYVVFVEGFFTGILVYAPYFLFYFVGWHSLLSVGIGWYYHHKLLLNSNVLKLALFSTALGIFWGFWSVIYWLPENVSSPDYEDFYKVGKWSVQEYSLFVLVFGGIYVVSHYLISYFWISEFKTSKIEDLIIYVVIALFAVVQVISSMGLGLITVLVFVLTYLVLKKYESKNQDRASLLQELRGIPPIKNLLVLLVMPLSSIVVYSTYYYVEPRLTTIRLVNLYGTYILQFLIGAVLLFLSLYFVAFKNHSDNVTRPS